MSARDKLIRSLIEEGYTEAWATARVAGVEREHAHELAEKIRAVNPQPDGWTEVTYNHAADLIDPEVSSRTDQCRCGHRRAVHTGKVMFCAVPKCTCAAYKEEQGDGS